MREGAVCALRAVALFVELAWAVVVIGTCLAFGALTFKVVLVEKLLVSDRFPAARRTSTFSMGFAACTTT